ncbi:hypothetical protein TNCV_1880131 [Trichonephila clavipes]|nr:hypothetical protein TNCV_1880131 [Trichonephila clavipes]
MNKSTLEGLDPQTNIGQSIKVAVDKRQIFSAVFVDFKLAYKLVWKENLLLKLSDITKSNLTCSDRFRAFQTTED